MNTLNNTLEDFAITLLYDRNVPITAKFQKQMLNPLIRMCSRRIFRKHLIGQTKNG